MLWIIKFISFDLYVLIFKIILNNMPKTSGRQEFWLQSSYLVF